MKIVCAWCLKEGKPGLMGEMEPKHDPTVSHGICPEHRLQVEAELIRTAEEAERFRKEAEDLRRKVDP